MSTASSCRPIKLQMRVWHVHVSRRGHGVVAASALWISRTVGHDRIVLSACHPLSSASKRIVILRSRDHYDGLQPARIGLHLTTGAAGSACI
jgi:hypothetical protein